MVTIVTILAWLGVDNFQTTSMLNHQHWSTRDMEGEVEGGWRVSNRKLDKNKVFKDSNTVGKMPLTSQD